MWNINIMHVKIRWGRWGREGLDVQGRRGRQGHQTMQGREGRGGRCMGTLGTWGQGRQGRRGHWGRWGREGRGLLAAACGGQLWLKYTCSFTWHIGGRNFQRPGLFVTSFFTKKANHLALSSQPGAVWIKPQHSMVYHQFSKHSDRYTPLTDKIHLKNLQKTFF